MQFADVVLTWKSSVKLLAWKELRLLILAGLNNFRRALKLTGRNFWWLWLLWIILIILPTAFHVLFTPHQLFDVLVLAKVHSFISMSEVFNAPFWTIFAFIAVTLGFILIDALLHFTYCLSTRASVEAKTFSYYLSYAARFGAFCLVLLPVFACVYSLALLSRCFIADANICSIVTTIINVLFFAFPAMVGYSLFDHEKHMFLYAIKTGLTIFIHFLPLFLVLGIMHLIVLFALYGIGLFPLAYTSSPWLVSIIVFSVYFAQAMIVHLLFLSFYATAYIKIKHGHPDLFFT